MASLRLNAASLSSAVRTAARGGKSSSALDPGLAEAVNREENKNCADCKRRGAPWASVNLGIFVCEECSGWHMKLGVHVSMIKSPSLHSWKPEWIDMCRKVGNRIGNDYYEARWTPNILRPGSESSTAYTNEAYFQRKYVKLDFAPHCCRGRQLPPLPPCELVRRGEEPDIYAAPTSSMSNAERRGAGAVVPRMPPPKASVAPVPTTPVPKLTPPPPTAGSGASLASMADDMPFDPNCRAAAAAGEEQFEPNCTRVGWSASVSGASANTELPAATSPKEDLLALQDDVFTHVMVLPVPQTLQEKQVAEMQNMLSHLYQDAKQPAYAQVSGVPGLPTPPWMAQVPGMHVGSPSSWPFGGPSCNAFGTNGAYSPAMGTPSTSVGSPWLCTSPQHFGGAGGCCFGGRGPITGAET
eukprot:TRINITY_DN8381_c0_g1_i1.p1 TRINITY_DN8381_c0_g1~~TRINITY_DN8381_c0_g1_i1.p1  ORF type:complete len:434 (-),score=78.88 TRINITY_DN8381_c0_g1_i1:121-1356(-)